MCKQEIIESVPQAVSLLTTDEFKYFCRFNIKDDNPVANHNRKQFAIWYRGQADMSWSLDPKVFRGPLGTHVEETNLLHHMQRRMPEHKSDRGIFDWLCLMQHHGLGTRLVDWSESILIALYFAVKDLNDKDGVLIVLNARNLNVQTTIFEEFEGAICTPGSLDVVARANFSTSRFQDRWEDGLRRLEKRGEFSTAEISNAVEHYYNPKIRKPVAVFPDRRHDRMLTQLSMFTIHGGKLYSSTTEGLNKKGSDDKLVHPLPLDEYEKEKCMKSFKIPKECKSAIMHELEVLGIHEGSLFPDLEHQASYIESYWMNDGFRET